MLIETTRKCDTLYIIKSSKGYWNKSFRSWQAKIYNADWYSSKIFVKGICEVVKSHKDVKVWTEKLGG